MPPQKCPLKKPLDALRLANTGTPHERITMNEPVSAGVALVESILKGLPPGVALDERERAFRVKEELSRPELTAWRTSRILGRS